MELLSFESPLITLESSVGTAGVYIPTSDSVIARSFSVSLWLKSASQYLSSSSVGARYESAIIQCTGP